MNNYDVLKQEEILDKDAMREVVTQDVWLLHISEGDETRLDFLDENGRASWGEPGDWLLLLNRVEVRVLEGALSLYPLRFEALSKLLAFIDESRNIDEFDLPLCWVPLKLQDVAVWQDRKRSEYWFLQQILDPSPAFNHLLALLRHSESYWLIRFLLTQSACQITLQKLGERYGVSYSHFRRLCRHALGSGAKAELRDWRMARSLLDVVERQENMTQVAIKHGYSSSSHFSNDIKELLGVSPRSLSNIINLASK